MEEGRRGERGGERERERETYRPVPLWMEIIQCMTSHMSGYREDNTILYVCSVRGGEGGGRENKIGRT